MPKSRAALALGLPQLVVAMALSNVASGAEAYHTSVIRYVYPLANGSFILAFQTDAASCTNGSSPKYYLAAVGQNGVTADGIKVLYAASLTAAAQGKTVTIAFDNATSNCYMNRINVTF